MVVSFAAGASASPGFVYALRQVNGAANQIYGFNLDSTTGALTAGSTTTPAANGVTNVAVDANGKFLYVGLPGSTTSNPSSVAVYSIDATTGALTAVGAPVASGTLTGGVAVTNSVN